jgi:phosphoserine phosphatase
MNSALPLTPALNAQVLQRRVGPLAAAAAGRRVFLVDGDRTLTAEDTSRTFLSRAGIDPMVIKARFEAEGYTFGSFRFHAEVHVALGEQAFATLAPLVADEVVPYAGAMEFLRSASTDAAVFVVSAGIPRIWLHLLDRFGLPEIEVIGGIDPVDPFVFGRAEKGAVAQLFRAQGCLIVGLGDSDVDAEMLATAAHAVVVTNHRRNADLVPHLADHPSCWQIVTTGAPLPKLPPLGWMAAARLGADPLLPPEAPCR